MIAVVALAVALAMDAFAAALAEGCARRPAPGHALAIAAAFGLAQAVMPLAGLALGVAAGPLVARIDHWLAFVLLGALGARMAWQGLADEADAAPPLAGRRLALVAFAISVDAAAAGITLPLLGVAPLVAAVLIGGVTFGLSLAGVLAGGRLGAALGRRAEIAGGLLLVGLGCKILVEHTLAA